jgi:hypothetical protein
MSSRKVHQAPTYTRIVDPKVSNRILLEIKRFKPDAEASVENCPALARGKIVDWNVEKSLFTVNWKKLPEEFAEYSGSRTGQRSFFKIQTFTTQIMFKTEIVRRLDETTYHYRTPKDWYQNQKRAALRVPIEAGSAKLSTPIGTFPILDLSTAGAALQVPESLVRKAHHFEKCTLILGSRRITTPNFGITITRRQPDQIGCRFHGLNEAIHIEIKQYLIEALQWFFKEHVKK